MVAARRALGAVMATDEWYPSVKSHRVIWVAPYVKGSGAMAETVYQVVR